MARLLVIGSLVLAVLTACGRAQDAELKASGPCHGEQISSFWWAPGGTVGFSEFCDITWRAEDAGTFARPKVVGRFEPSAYGLSLDIEEEVGGLLAGKRDCAYSVRTGGLGSGRTLTITCDNFIWKSGRPPKPQDTCGAWGCS